MFVLPLFGDRKPVAFAQMPFSEGGGQFSPNGRWIVYRTFETGRAEVYVASFPTPGRKWQVSTVGGDFPRWRRHEIFYMTPDNKLMAAAVSTEGGRVEVGTVRPLFDMRRGFRGGRYFYDVSSDGQRFLLNAVEEQASMGPLTLVVNWPAALRN